MKYPDNWTKSHFLIALRAGILPMALTTFLWLTSSNAITAIQFLIALALLMIPWVSYLGWRRRLNDELPVFAMISFMYWLYYVMALFWGDLIIHVARTPLGHPASSDALTLAMSMCLLGICCLWLGVKVRLAHLIAPRKLVEVSVDLRRRNYLRGVLIVSVVLSLIEPSAYLLGEGGRQIVSISLSFIPLLAFTILLRLYLKGEASQMDKILILGFLVTRLVGGLSSGWLGAAASIMIICAATYLAERRRVPGTAVIAVMVFTLFFQVGKNEFRHVYWTQKTEASQLDRVSFWVDTSLEKWSTALSDPSGDDVKRLVNQSISRVSLLTQSAHVLEQTPNVVPYQYGKMYSYLLVTLIPRFVWPAKPSVNEANQFYQIAYGVTAEQDINKVAIGVGVLTEAFISFGWLGVIGMMFLMGIFFDLYQRTLLQKTSGLFMSSLGIALLPQMLGIESQMAAYLGGIVQQVLFSLFILLPIIRLNKSRKRVHLATSTARSELRAEGIQRF